MLLQTFVQLNILLLAAPALAGWVMSPVAYPTLAQAAQVVFQPAARQAEPTAQAVEDRHAPLPLSPVITQPAAPMVKCSDAMPLLTPPASAAPIVTLFNPFPHATRAP